MSPISRRVSARSMANRATVLRVATRKAMEFPNPEALKHYLHEHPGADKSLHTVHKPDHKEPKKTEGLSWKDLANRFTAKARSFIETAPKAVQSFVHDESFRKEALKSAGAAIKAAPGEFVRRVIEEGKEEAHEIKTAGQGLVSALRGKGMSHEQRHALRKVATHVAIATAATALTGGLALGAAAMAKGTAGAFVSSLAKKIALKAVTKKLQILPTMEELGHAGHGAVHSMGHLFEHFLKHSAEDPTPEEAFQAFVAAAVADGIENIDPDSVLEAIEEASNSV